MNQPIPGPVSQSFPPVMPQPMLSGHNPFMMPQMMMPPPSFSNCFYPSMFNSLPGYYEQQMRSYQMFYPQYQNQYQPNITIDIFQHQG